MKLVTKYNYPKSIRAYYNGQRMYNIGSEKLPSVTTILSATQTEEKKASLEAWRRKIGKKAADLISRQSLSTGSAMHDFIEKYCLGKLNLDLLGDNTLERKMADQIIEHGLKNRVSEIWGVEACLYYPNKYAGAADLICIMDGKETVVDFKSSRSPRKDQYNFDYYLQLGGYSLAHNVVYGTKIDQGVILVCTKDLMFQRFIVDSENLKNYQKLFLERVDQYYNMQLNN